MVRKKQITNQRYRFIGAVTLLVFMFCIAPVGAEYVEVYNPTDLFENLSKAGTHTIVVMSDIEINSTVQIQGDITLIPGRDSDVTLYWTKIDASKPLFIINAGGKLIIQDNGFKTLTIEGNSNARRSLVEVYGGTLTMQGGILTRNTALEGGAVAVYAGMFDMSGGTITKNAAIYGGGVSVNGGTFTMSGGLITENTAKNGEGGGVNIESSSTFMMIGGTVIGNTADDGGGVFIDGGTFTMTGGTIAGNTAKNGGGGVYFNNGTFKVYGTPKISGNWVGDAKTRNNVQLTSKTITISGYLGEKAEIYVTPSVFIGGTAIATGSSSYTVIENDRKVFHADIDGYTIFLYIENNELEIMETFPVEIGINQYSIEVPDFVTLKNAFAWANGGKKGISLTMVITDSFLIEETLLIGTPGSDITIIMIPEENNSHILTFKEGTAFNIISGGNLIISDDEFGSHELKLVSPRENGVVLVNSGTFTMKKHLLDGGAADFCDETFYRVIMPDGYQGEVSLSIKSNAVKPEGVETIAAAEISVTESIVNGLATIQYKVPLSSLDAHGFGADDVCLYVSEDGEWVKRETTYHISRDIVYYEAKTTNFGSVVVVFEEGGSTEQVPTDIPGTEEPESPGFSVLAAIAGLCVVAVLRRR